MNASGAGRHGWVPTVSANLYGGTAVCVLGHACARVRDVFAIYDNNI